MRANEEPRMPEIIAFIDWYEERSQYIVVTERPENCETLWEFVDRFGGSITEDAARHVMRQVVRASIGCSDRGVLHRDIKMTNLLLNHRSMEVKLIDFGSGDFLSPEPYTLFSGTLRFCPPEYLHTGMYLGEEATVWSLGVLLYRLVHGYYPTKSDYSWPSEELSKECCQLISFCLQQNPKYRVELDEILQHKWFEKSFEDWNRLSIYMPK